MQNYITLFIFIVLFNGCSTAVVNKNNTLNQMPQSLDDKIINAQSESLNNQEKQSQVKVLKKGGVLAKVEFTGFLKKGHVQLMIVDQKNPQRKYQLQLGKDSTFRLPWQTNPISGGYFYIQLPEGQYKIKSISIPVGSSKAVEESNLSFMVLPQTENYLGTLRINGIKQRIKLGGVPVIRPGFDYTVEVIDEYNQMISELKQKMPGSIKFETMLISVN